MSKQVTNVLNQRKEKAISIAQKTSNGVDLFPTLTAYEGFKQAVRMYAKAVK